MASARPERRLAAILALDVVGYARLVGADEAGTVARWRELRGALIEPAVAAGRGRIVKLMGDGVLAEFPSAVGAVEAAVAIQTARAVAAAAEPGARRMLFRVGVNLGDVLVEGDDILGDGVNIAARLEQLAAPGGICVSAKVHDEIQGRLALELADLGEREVKNIARPVRVWAVTGQGLAVPDAAEPAAAALPSIVVLPFENRGGDAEQGYFADGIAEDVITDLARIGGLTVIARNTAFAYRDRRPDPREVARELGVRWVLGGSVRRAGGRVRVTAELVDARTGGPVWAERYDRELGDIFATQDELTAEIVGQLQVKLSDAESRRLGRRGTASVEAWDAFLRGRDLAWRHAHETFAAARGLLERAIELDPGFAAAHAWLAQLHIQNYNNGWEGPPQAALAEARAMAERAAAIDREEAAGHFALGMVEMWSRHHDGAEREARLAVELSPSSAEHHMLLGVVLTYAGRPEEGLPSLRRALQLDPQTPPLGLYFLAQALFGAERWAEARGALDERLRRDPASETSLVLRAACRGYLGDLAGARADWEEALRINPRYSLAQRRRVLPYRHARDFDRLVEGLRRAGIVDGPASG